jgi:hypothetical protein
LRAQKQGRPSLSLEEELKLPRSEGAACRQFVWTPIQTDRSKRLFGGAWECNV